MKSAPLLGNSISTIATVAAPKGLLSGVTLAVTSTTLLFMTSPAVEAFPLSGLPPGGPTTISSPGFQGCDALTSDTAAVYCSDFWGTDPNLSISPDGTFTPLDTAISSSPIVVDDTYAYWADMTTVGSIMKAPKAGGGTATVLAWDANPTAIAVDAHSVYWSDQQGYIKSVAK